MANNESATPVSTEPAVEAVAGQAVEGAIAATPDPAEYAEPSADHKADLLDDEFGDEGQYIVEAAKADGAEPGQKREPQGIIAAHP
ncbi:hypothetical protein ACIPYS_35295 [Kitasatospora sp. NPDC089913]|uniref:hypothetical protein n=1 Tax=Streptomycetaceae TaxID=2062 RepID=UPI00087CF2D5|nr:hypothetical protein [Streptomyces sp. TLI_053]SDT64766.1 hypothetical protein SAMN05216371_3375 [Streptomyces sp. TLI_053]